jgi:hypothetical protein
MSEASGGVPIQSDDKKSARLFEWRQPWEITRQQGKDSFILKHGVLGWGGFMFIVSTCMYILDNRNKHLVLYLVSALMAWSLGGYLMGWWIWQGNENRYLSEKELQDSITKVPHGPAQG